MYDSSVSPCDNDPLVCTSEHSHSKPPVVVSVPVAEPPAVVRWIRQAVQPQEDLYLQHPTVSQVIRILGRVSVGSSESTKRTTTTTKTKKRVRFGLNQVHKIVPTQNLDPEQALWWTAEEVKKIHYQCMVVMHEFLQDEDYVWALLKLHRLQPVEEPARKKKWFVHQDAPEVEEDGDETENYDEEEDEEEDDDGFFHDSFTSTTTCSMASTQDLQEHASTDSEDDETARRILTARGVARGLEVRIFKKTATFLAMKKLAHHRQMRHYGSFTFALTMAELDAQEAAVAYAYE